VNHDVVAQVQAHIASGVVDFNNLAGPYAEQVRQTLEALQKYHGDHVLAKSVTTDEIEVCFMLGNATFNSYILAISIGAVFFGANTYIGNGPNFMVKAIAEQQKVRTPSFLTYVWKYTLPVMLPMLVIVWLLFFFR
jgi:di/tricarboxylate transporter